jgi:hypothetical protein
MCLGVRVIEVIVEASWSASDRPRLVGLTIYLMQEGLNVPPPTTLGWVGSEQPMGCGIWWARWYVRWHGEEVILVPVMDEVNPVSSGLDVIGAVCEAESRRG